MSQKPYQHIVNPRVLQNFVIAEPVPIEEEVTSGGIVLPGREGEYYLSRGRIRYVGEGCTQDLKPGDYVLLHEMASQNTIHINGEDLRVFLEDTVIAVVNPTEGEEKAGT